MSMYLRHYCQHSRILCNRIQTTIKKTHVSTNTTALPKYYGTKILFPASAWHWTKTAATLKILYTVPTGPSVPYEQKANKTFVAALIINSSNNNNNNSIIHKLKRHIEASNNWEDTVVTLQQNYMYKLDLTYNLLNTQSSISFHRHQYFRFGRQTAVIQKLLSFSNHYVTPLNLIYADQRQQAAQINKTCIIVQQYASVHFTKTRHPFSVLDELASHMHCTDCWAYRLNQPVMLIHYDTIIY